jgi:hypothetical protein
MPRSLRFNDFRRLGSRVLEKFFGVWHHEDRSVFLKIFQ